MSELHFIQKIRFEIDGGDELNIRALSNRMIELYGAAVEFMNGGGIEEFNRNYDNLTEYPMNVELYDWLFDHCFTEMANKISVAFTKPFIDGRHIYLGEGSAFIFNPEEDVTVMKGCVQ